MSSFVSVSRILGALVVTSALVACGAATPSRSGLTGGESVNNGQQLSSNLRVIISKVVSSQRSSASVFSVAAADGSVTLVDAMPCTTSVLTDFVKTVCENDNYKFEMGHVVTGPLRSQLTIKASNRHFGYACKKPQDQLGGVDVTKLYECDQAKAPIGAR